MAKWAKCESCIDDIHECDGFDDDGNDCTCRECGSPAPEKRPDGLPLVDEDKDRP